MQRLRLAVASRCLMLPLKDCVRRAAQIGASGIQFDARNELRPADLSETGRRQLLHALSEMKLAAASLDFPTRRSLCDPDQLDARISALKEAMQLASRLKADVVTVRAETIAEDAASTEYQLLLGVLSDLARYGNHIGVTLSLTTGRQATKPLLQILSAVTEGPLGVNFDPAGLVAAGAGAGAGADENTPAGAYRALFAHVTHVLARDAVRDSGIGREVPLGRGEVAWDELFALFEESGYSGWLTVDRTQGDDKPGDAARAVQYLKQLAIG